MATKYTKWSYNKPNGHTIYQHLPLKDPPKFTQTGIFVLKIWQPCHHLSAGNRFLPFFKSSSFFRDAIIISFLTPPKQGCQMALFQTKNPNLGKF
jgi:hypothetical protein